MKETLRPRLPTHASLTLQRFLRAHVEEAGAKGLVVGLSGGIDSALVLRLGVEALGASRMFAVSMPDAATPRALQTEVAEYARGLGTGFQEVPIAPLEAPFLSTLGGWEDVVDRGNLKARIRMIVLYHEARRRGLLVAGTGNKSELLLGYFTKYGDGGVDLLPIGDLYKTGVRELSEALGLPEPIRQRPPSAGLWEGQTDEAELGMSYEELDRILFGLERLLEPEEIAPLVGLPLDRVVSVAERVRRYRHKRRTPPIPKVSIRTLGVDWRD